LAGKGLGYEKVAFGVAYKNSNICETSQDWTKVTNEDQYEVPRFPGTSQFIVYIDDKKNCRFTTSVTMTKLNVGNGKNSFIVFSHVCHVIIILCHHLLT